MKKTITVILGFFIVIFLFWWMFSKIDIALFLQYLVEGDKLLLLLGTVIYLVSFAVRALRWKLLLGDFGNFGTWKLCPMVFAGYAVNNTLPARMGEVVRAIVAGKNLKISKTAAFASIFVERVFDGVTIALVFSLTLLFSPFQDERMKNGAYIASALFALLFLFLIAAAFSPIPLRIVLFLKEKSPKFLHIIFDFTEKFLKGAASLHSWQRIVSVTLLSFLTWIIELSVYYMASIAFGVELPLNGYLLMLSLVNLGMLAAPTPGGLGFFQGAVIIALGFFPSISKETSMAVGIGLHLMHLIPVTVIGLIWLWINQIKISSISSD